MNSFVKRRLSVSAIVVCSLMLTFCGGSGIEKHQGIYVVNKDSLRTLMAGKVETGNGLATLLLEKVIENAVIEFELKRDSIDGVMFLAGESVLINSIVKVRNDSLVIELEGSEAYLIPTASGLAFKRKGSELALPMTRSENVEISAETQRTGTRLSKEAEQLKKFESGLGIWQKGTFVDEFGDETGGGFAVTIVRGTTQNSVSSNSKILVKTIVERSSLYFEFYNETMSLKESLPDSEFGRIKIKFPNGEIKTEKVFFYKNTISESPSGGKPIIFEHLMRDDGELKIFVDLSTAGKYHSDTYQFALSRKNLPDVLSDLQSSTTK